MEYTYMDYVGYLKQISQPFPEIAAQRIVDQEIDFELQQIRQRSHHGFYHEHVKSNGYPLSRNVLASAPYFARPDLELRLRNSVEQRRNMILLGCEGSGKTTLIHRVIGELAHDHRGLFIYVDVSDVDVHKEPDYADTIYKKLVAAINLTVPAIMRDGFEQWHSQQSGKGNLLIAPLLRIDTPKNLAEVFFSYLRTMDSEATTYFILDNIDSLSIAAAKALFNVLNLADDNVQAICKGLNLRDNSAVRYIIACRTPTFSHVTNYSQGLFLGFPYLLIQVDDNFLTETSVLGLLRTSILGLSNLAHSLNTAIEVPIAPSTTIKLTFGEYARKIFDWVEPREPTFDKTIKFFCGRSIRRAKLFGLKVLANPIVATLALMETYDVVQITRTDRNYLKRRLQEALLDFPTKERSRALGLIGFPMNPFRVIVDDSEFRYNPLIGVVGISYLKESQSALACENIYFASSIAAQLLLDHLTRIGYSNTSIKDFFCACRDCGLLRPISSSPVIDTDPAEHRHIHETYVVDERALANYYDLIYCRQVKLSMVFYNSAVRSHYDISIGHHLDNIMYEVFTSLVFLSDIMHREEQLESLIAGTGVLFQPMSSRIRSAFIPYLSGVFHSARENYGKEDKDIVDAVAGLFEQVKLRIGRSAGII